MFLNAKCTLINGKNVIIVSVFYSLIFELPNSVNFILNEIQIDLGYVDFDTRVECDSWSKVEIFCVNLGQYSTLKLKSSFFYGSISKIFSILS